MTKSIKLDPRRVAALDPERLAADDEHAVGAGFQVISPKKHSVFLTPTKVRQMLPSVKKTRA